MSFNIIKNTLETQENGVLIIENDVYRIIQDRLFMSDFDKYMLELEENAKK